MERPDFFELKNGQKVKLPFTDKEYQNRLLKLRKILADQMEFLMSHIPKSSPIFERYKIG